MVPGFRAIYVEEACWVEEIVSDIIEVQAQFVSSTKSTMKHSWFTWLPLPLPYHLTIASFPHRTLNVAWKGEINTSSSFPPKTALFCFAKRNQPQTACPQQTRPACQGMIDDVLMSCLPVAAMAESAAAAGAGNPPRSDANGE